jgi:hypothetical protein
MRARIVLANSPTRKREDAEAEATMATCQINQRELARPAPRDSGLLQITVRARFGT